MITDTFDFTFKHEGKTFPASVVITTIEGYKEMPFKYPLYRINVEDKQYKTFIFHEVNAPKQMFFWYELKTKKQKMAESIAKKLEKMKKLE